MQMPIDLFIYLSIAAHARRTTTSPSKWELDEERRVKSPPLRPHDSLHHHKYVPAIFNQTHLHNPITHNITRLPIPCKQQTTSSSRTMFRKVAIVLVLAASFLGAQAADLPKPVRELTGNKTAPAAKNTGARSKAKTAEVCIARTGLGVMPQFAPLPADSPFLAIITGNVYDCDNVDRTTGVPAAGATPIGVVG